MLPSGAIMADNSTPPFSPQAVAAIAIVITFMIILTIVGNVLVIIAVLTSRSLRAPQNLFLVSLAAADILVAMIIIPFSLANELQGYWPFSSIWCEIYQALDVLFCTSSIVHLCAIALDRYLSISQPVSYGTKRTAVRIKAAIVVVWLISAVISFPPLLTLGKKEGGEGRCQLNEKPWYILYSTIGSFFAPCVIMILVYVRIYQIAKRHTRCPPGQKRRSPHGAEAEAKSPPEEPQTDGGQRAAPEKVLSPTTNKKPPEAPPPLSSTEVPPPDPPQAEGEDALHTPSSESDPELQTVEEQDRAGGGAKPKAPLQSQNAMKTSSGTKLVPAAAAAAATATAVAAAKAQETRNSRRKAMLNREKRFTFVLAVVMGVFVVCWFPFFFCYSLTAVCPHTCHTPQPLFRFFFWIGYCNSCLNPVIYTVFNQDFRNAFKRILSRGAKGTPF